MSGPNSNAVKTRQERREERLRKRKSKVRQHGRGLARVYRNAILRRVATGKRKKQDSEAML